MATKEEHLWYIRSNHRRVDEFTLCEALAERDAAREELERAVKDVDPSIKTPGPLPSSLETSTFTTESAPVVGGVTEAMLDELWRALPESMEATAFLDSEDWFDRARAAIRAQKRVDVEAIRAIANALFDGGMRHIANEIRRAIGDEPAEAPVAEPAAPAQEGPYMFDYGGRGPYMYIRRDGKEDVVLTNLRTTTGEELAALLNAGLEAEKLRARVAELEGELDQAREHRDAYGRDREALKARADAAEANLAALGENPIPRALVVRHRNHCTANQWLFTADAIDEILAGREPGVAS